MKKVLSLALAAMMLFAFAGCNQTQESAAAKDDPNVRYTVTWATWMGENVTEDAVTVAFLENKYNIDIDIISVPLNSWDEIMGPRLAGGDIPDIISTRKNHLQVPMYASQGVVLELPVDFLKEKMPEWSAYIDELDPRIWKQGDYEGKHWAIQLPNFRGNYRYPITWNSDWLKAVGITKVPETLDEFEEAFLKFRNDDPDKNGKKDTYGFTTPSNQSSTFIFNEFFGAFGVAPFQFMEENGKLVYGFTKPETKDALKLLNKWYELGIIDPEFITEDGRSGGNDISWKFATEKIGYISNLDGGDYQWDNDGHLNAKWVIDHPDSLQYVYEGGVAGNKLLYHDAFKDLATVPTDVYVHGNPPLGPNGKIGQSVPGYECEFTFLGVQLGEKENEGKLTRILKMLNDMGSDPETFRSCHMGVQSDETHRAIYTIETDPVYGEYADFTPEFLASKALKKPSRYGQFNPFNVSAKKLYTTVMGRQRISRMKMYEEICTDYIYPNPVKAALDSLGTYGDHETVLRQFLIKAITGESAIDGEWEKTVETWKNNGGNAITEEANAWYASIK